MIQVFYLFDEKKNGVIEFDEFIHALSVFHPLAPMENKINCMYATCKNYFLYIHVFDIYVGIYFSGLFQLHLGCMTWGKLVISSERRLVKKGSPYLLVS